MRAKSRRVRETTRLVDTGWEREIRVASHEKSSELRVICPFIKEGALSSLLVHKPHDIQVITRFSLRDFATGVSDIAALTALLATGARVRGVRNLHAKLYLFGDRRAIVTSANLTNAALNRNHEFGLVSRDEPVIAACRTYFDDLWGRAGSDLTTGQLRAWNGPVERCRAERRGLNSALSLPDYGVDLGIKDVPPLPVPIAVADAPQAFVKFLGEGNNRVPLSFEVIDEIDRAGCHWAVAYPSTKRPTGVREGAAMFIGRLTRDPNDIRIFGRAVGMRYVPGRDDATPEEVARRTWKATWSRYVRVHQSEFVAGTMANGVSLNEMMRSLGASAFASTKRNAAQGTGNTDPRKAYRQQAAVELSPEGFAWLSGRLQAALVAFGSVPLDTLRQID